MKLARDATPLLILQLKEPSRKGAQILFRQLALAHIGVDFQETQRLACFIRPHGPAAGNGYPSAISPGVLELTFPGFIGLQMLCYVRQRKRKLGMQDIVHGSSDNFVLFPAVKALGAAIPVCDLIIHTAHKDGVIGQIQHLRLFRNVLFRPRALRDIAVDFQDAHRLMLLVVLQDPAGLYGDS